MKEIQYLAARDGDGIESERCGCGVPKSLNVEIVAVDCFLLTWFSTKLTFKLNICLKS